MRETIQDKLAILEKSLDTKAHKEWATMLAVGKRIFADSQIERLDADVQNATYDYWNALLDRILVNVNSQTAEPIKVHM